MNSDFKELLQSLADHNVRYMVAGGYAVIHHSQPRYTKDLDIWIDATEENATRLMKAFSDFGIPLVGVEKSDFAQIGTQFSIGVAPSELDFLTTISGLNFESAWENRVTSNEGDFEVIYLGKGDLITAKRAVGRLQDLADIEEIERVQG